ncbi:unnamed protein product, partial [Prorocentrum cordatum]
APRRQRRGRGGPRSRRSAGLSPRPPGRCWRSAPRPWGSTTTTGPGRATGAGRCRSSSTAWTCPATTMGGPRAGRGAQVLLLSSQAGGDVEGAGMTALAFKKLVGSDPRAAGAAPLSLRTIRSGCFGPEGGEAGPAPWQLRGAQPVPEPARLSSPPGVGDKGGEQVAEDTDQPDSAGLGPWDRVLRFEDARTPARAAGSDLDAAAGEMAPWSKGGNDILGLHVEHAPHPPRTQFVQFTCQSEIKARLSPKWIAVLSLLSQDLPPPPLVAAAGSNGPYRYPC